MKQFERTEVLLIRCSPEFKKALNDLCNNFYSASDKLHYLVASAYRHVDTWPNTEKSGMTPENLQKFCDALGNTGNQSEERKRTRQWQKEQLKKLKLEQKSKPLQP